ncbi:MAG: SGNH/GDSL hydrolase family protein [Oscillospiraceae bacterium]|nr:SGNH/GDSL hydrolase family protein [Oscillospiraceae bacterium]
MCPCPRVSVLGDSISTLEGVSIPAGMHFYTPALQRLSGVAAPADTWWGMVIHALGGVRGAVCAQNGLTLSGRFGAGDPQRIAALAAGGMPDCIWVAAGLNDWALGVPPEQVLIGCQTLLQRLRAAYPDAAIVIGTLPQGMPVPEEAAFFSAEAVAPQTPYNNSIRAAAEIAQCRVAELAAASYETMDGVHPTRRGMAQLAAAWLAALEKRWHGCPMEFL